MRRARVATAALAVAALAIVVTGVWRAAASDPRELAAALQDDSFYYLLPAYRAWSNGGVLTFDGEHTTFGVQPAFAALLAALAGPCTDRVVFLRAACALVCVLYAATALGIAAVVRRALESRGIARVDARAAAAFAGVSWCANLPVLAGFTTLKENVLYALLLLPALHVALTAELAARPARAIVLGAWLGVGLATRLTPSSLAIAAVLAAAAVARSGRRAGTAVRVAAGAIAAMLPFAWYGLVVSGRVLPTSGAVKLAPLRASLVDGTFWHTLPEHAARVPGHLLGCALYALGLPHHGFFVPQHPPPPHTAGVVIAAATAAGAVVLWRSRRRLTGLGGALAALVLAALAGKATTPVLLGGFGDVAYFQWYVAALPLFVPLVAAAAVLALPARARVPAVVVAAAAAVLQLATHVTPMPVFRADERSWTRQMLVATASANTLLPAGARVAAANAGALGYFARDDLVVVNVDGLANDDWFASSRAGVGMTEYLDRERISHLCDVLVPGGWHGNVFDRVAPVDVVPFAGPDYPGYFLLERVAERFPDFWPAGGGGVRPGAWLGPCVPWVDGDPIAATAGPSPLRTLPSGRRGVWRSLRADRALDGELLAVFRPGGRYARLRAHAGGAACELVVLADAGELARVACTANRWSEVDVDVGDAARVELRTRAAASREPLWVAGIAWEPAREREAPPRAAIAPFGNGCSNGEHAPPRLAMHGAPAPGAVLSCTVHASTVGPGVLCVVRDGTPTRFGPLEARDPCIVWATGDEVAVLLPFTTDAAGNASLDVPLPAALPAGRYVAQVLLGAPGARSGLSNGLLLAVAPPAR